LGSGRDPEDGEVDNRELRAALLVFSLEAPRYRGDGGAYFPRNRPHLRHDRLNPV